MAEALLDQLLRRVQKLPEADRAALVAETLEATKGMKIIPTVGPQADAYRSKADVVLFGGEPGGGKTGLALALALNCHERSLLMRRQYTDLDAMIEEAIKFNGTRDGFNGSPPPKLRHDRGIIDFGAAAKPGDEQHWMGRPHDLIAIDEATQFTGKQIRFIRGWCRTTTPGQRCRTLLATNPPLSADGEWVFVMFAPWLNPQHPNPAKPGELRWFIVDEDDKDIEVAGPGEYTLDSGAVREAESRTFIPSSTADNPFLSGTDYKKRLDALPAEVREVLLGGFRRSFRDQPFQTIPTAWITAAQARWTQRPPDGVPMCAMGVDATGGGTDPFVMAMRYDGWFAPLIEVPGKEIPRARIGRHCAGLVVSHRLHDATIVVDMGGGYGGSTYETLLENLDTTAVVAYKGAEASTRRTHDKKLGFYNTRSAAIWAFREALDPAQENGSPIALPDDPVLVADLTASTFEMGARGIKVKDKEDVCKGLGRSTNRGDAVVMSWYAGARNVVRVDVNSAEHGSYMRPRKGRDRALQVSYGHRRPGGMNRR
jgi:hypothetical protein